MLNLTRKRGALSGDDEVAGGDQLAAGGRGESRDGCEHRKASGLQLQHELCAAVEHVRLLLMRQPRSL